VFVAFVYMSILDQQQKRISSPCGQSLSGGGQEVVTTHLSSSVSVNSQSSSVTSRQLTTPAAANQSSSELVVQEFPSSTGEFPASPVEFRSVRQHSIGGSESRVQQSLWSCGGGTCRPSMDSMLSDGGAGLMVRTRVTCRSVDLDQDVFSSELTSPHVISCHDQRPPALPPKTFTVSEWVKVIPSHKTLLD